MATARASVADVRPAMTARSPARTCTDSTPKLSWADGVFRGLASVSCGRHYSQFWFVRNSGDNGKVCLLPVRVTMVQTSKTDHFFKLALFRSPLTDLIDSGIAGKLLTSGTRRCSPFVDSVSRIWIKPKKSLIGCWGPTVAAFCPISAVASTTNGRPQRSQPPFRSAFLGHFSLP